MDEPQEDVTDNLGLNETLTSCVVTRAMKKKLYDNDKNESDVDSSVSCN